MREAVEEFFQLENAIDVHRAHGFVAGPGVDTVLFGWMMGCMRDRRQEIGPNHFQWSACDGVQEQDNIFGFLFDGVKWHRWRIWNREHLG